MSWPAEVVRAGDGYVLLRVDVEVRCEMLDGSCLWEADLRDARAITPRQRGAIYATLRDVAAYTGYDADDCKKMLKCSFCAETGARALSFSDCTETEARAFLGWLIDFCVEQGVPASESLLNRCEDVSRYVYCCTLHKVCCVTGRRAQLHHVDAVGMGRDRREIVHLGMRVLPLCAEMHREAHTLGQAAFLQKYKLEPVRVDARIADAWGLRKKKRKK